MKKYFWARAYSRNVEGNESVDKEEHFNSKKEARDQVRKWGEEDRFGLYIGFSVDIGDVDGEPLKPKEAKAQAVR